MIFFFSHVLELLLLAFEGLEVVWICQRGGNGNCVVLLRVGNLRAGSSFSIPCHSLSVIPCGLASPPSCRKEGSEGLIRRSHRKIWWGAWEAECYVVLLLLLQAHQQAKVFSSKIKTLYLRNNFCTKGIVFLHLNFTWNKSASTWGAYTSSFWK